MKVSHLYKRYQENTVLADVTLGFPPESVSCIMGPSGCGKTTLLRCIAGLEQPNSGTVEDVPQPVSFVFQEDRLCGGFDAAANIRLAAGPALSDAVLAAHLAELGLTDCGGLPAENLSGGQQRRVAIARAVCYGGKLLLLDEPFKGLDPDTRRRTAAYIRRRAAGATVICVTHDRDDAELLGAEQVIDLQNISDHC